MSNYGHMSEFPLSFKETIPINKGGNINMFLIDYIADIEHHTAATEISFIDIINAFNKGDYICAKVIVDDLIIYASISEYTYSEDLGRGNILYRPVINNQEYVLLHAYVSETEIVALEPVTISHNNLTDKNIPDQHPMTSITGLGQALNRKQDNIDDLAEIRENAAAVSGKAPLVHSHAISDVTNLQDALDAKQPTGDYLVPNDLNNYYDKDEIDAALDTKQPTGNYVTETELINNYYEKDDIDNFLDNYYDKADINDVVDDISAALNGKQPVGNYALKSELPTDLADLLDDANHRLTSDTEKQTWNNKSDFDGSYNSLTDTPNLANVATSGDYNDLDNTPTIPVIPTDVSAFNNDAGYLTLDTLPVYDGTVEDVSSENSEVTP